MARDRNKLNTLEVLTEIYAYSSGLKTTFDQYVDTRFESSLDIQSRLSIKALENNTYAGNKVEVEGIVLRTAPSDSEITTPGDSDYLRRVTAENKILGLNNTPALSSARVKILPRKGERSSPTDIYYDPYTYDLNTEDIALINQFPLFFYESSLEIVPGAKVRALYDYGTFSSGMILERLPDEIINLLTGSEAENLVSRNFNSGVNADLFGQILINNPPETELTAEVYPPNAQKTIDLLTRALQYSKLPTEWATLKSTHYILGKESGGKVGIPNYTYIHLPGREHYEIMGIKNKPDTWPLIWEAARNDLPGKYKGNSTATGLGQLLSSNVKIFYPDGVNGIGDALNEAVGFVKYLHSRYGDPDTAGSVYGRMGRYTNTRTNKVMNKTFREGY